MSDDNGMAEAAVATMREAMAKALGGNCAFVDDDGFLLAALARRAIDAGLAEDLNPKIIRNMKRRDQLEDENFVLRALNAELIEALNHGTINQLLGMIEDSGASDAWSLARSWIELRDRVVARAENTGGESDG